MTILSSVAGTTLLPHDERHGPLVPLLLVLTVVTGLVDAVSYLQLGHVFVANMNGMGLQNAVARRLAVPDLTTTVLTLTLTGIAADSTLARGSNPHPARRIAATVTMLLGAAVGAVFVLNVGVGAVLALALALLALTGSVAYRVSSSSAPWTAGAWLRIRRS